MTKHPPRIATILLIATFLVTALTTSVFIYVYGKNEIAHDRKLVEERDRLFASSLANGTHLYIGKSAEIVEFLAASINLYDTPEALQAAIESATENHPDFFSFAVGDKDGKVIAVYNDRGTTEAERRPIGLSTGDRQYFKDVVATRKTVVSEALTSKVSAVPAIGIVAPRFDENKEFAGYVSGGLTLDALYHLAEGALGSEFAIPVIVDYKGQVAVHPNKTFVAEHKNLSAFEPAKRALAGETGFIPSFRDSDGVYRSAAYTPIPEYGWGVWVAQDTVQFASTERRVLITGIIWGFATLFGIFLIYAVLAGMFFRPFEKVTEQATAIIEKNDFDKRIDLRGSWEPYEVSTIVDAFNRLIDKVGHSFEKQQESLKMKTKFLTVATHAFRTPITVLQWTLSSMMSRLDSYKIEQKEEIRDLYEGTQRLSFGFENLFTSLQIQERTGRLEPKEVKLTSLVSEVVTKLKPIVQRVGIEMSQEGEEHVAELDEGKMRRVIEILLSNAVFYNRKGGDVTVSVSRDDGHVVLVVRDSGIGMTEFEMEHAFEPFFRGEMAAKKYTDGTGLGLYIAKAFVDMHRGTITIRSKEGQETVVTVRLPVKITFNEEMG